MTSEEIYLALAGIFSEVFVREDIELKPELSAKAPDVANPHTRRGQLRD